MARFGSWARGEAGAFGLLWASLLLLSAFTFERDVLYTGGRWVAGFAVVVGLVWLCRSVWWSWLGAIALDALPPHTFCPKAALRTVKRWMRTQGHRLKSSSHRKRAGLWGSGFAVGSVRPRMVCGRVMAIGLLLMLGLSTSVTVAVAAGDVYSRSNTVLSFARDRSADVAVVGVLRHYVGSYTFFHPDHYDAGRITSAIPVPTAAATIADLSPGGEETILKQPEYTQEPVGKWTWGHHPGMSEVQFQRLQEAVRARKRSFAYSLKELPGYNGTEKAFTVKLKTSEPIVSKQRQYSVIEKQIREEKMGEMRDTNMLEKAPHNTIYASCPHFPSKRDAQGNWTDKRVTIDFRKINQHTEKDQYGLHRPEELFQKVSKAKYFSKIDLRSGFHQIPIDPDSRSKTAFWWGNELWQYTRLPMGLSNSPAAFQRILDHEINAAGLTGSVACFIDDLLVFSDTPEEHVKHVSQILDRLFEVGLRAHPEKSIFGTAVIEYLGHNVSNTGIHPTTAKILAIKELRVPTDVNQLQSVLGYMNYYRGYVPNYSQLQAPLNALLKKGAVWNWTEECQQAYDQLKEALCKEGNALRRYQPELETKLYTDWSKQGVGAVLAQVDEHGVEKMVACISRSLNVHEKNYSSYEGELLAAVWAIKTFRVYLHGIKFTVITDHQPLLWLMTCNELTGKHARWALMLQDFDFTIEHRPGLKHQNADVPSRFPREDSRDTTGARLDPEPEEPSTASHTACFAQMGGDTTDTVTSFLSAFRLNLLDGLDAAGAGEGFIDDFAPTADQLLDGHAFKLSRHYKPEPTSPAPAVHQEQVELATKAAAWVQEARPKLVETPPLPVQSLTHTAFSDSYGVHSTTGLNTSLVGSSFFQAAKGEGVVLLELFGGLAAGLSMCLANGVKVQRYLYCDIDPKARKVARMQINKLHGQYPDLFPLNASAGSFDVIPQDVRRITTESLVEAGALQGDQWLVVAGWECQDLSAAGNGRGLDGPRSSTFFDTVRTIGALQQLQHTRMPAYLLENSPLQYNWRSKGVRLRDYPRVVQAVGEPITCDAAQFGSLAHRVRNYWTNLADARAVNLVVQGVHRAEGLLVNSILDTGRVTQVAKSLDFAPAFSCNRVGKPLRALPTLVSYPASRAFRNGKSGQIVDCQGRLVEPNPDERERALGYTTGTTAHPDLTLHDRHVITGRCMDRNAVCSLFAICAALSANPFPSSPTPIARPSDVIKVQPETSGSPPELQSSDTDLTPFPSSQPSLHALLHMSQSPGPVSCCSSMHCQDLANCLASEVVNVQEAQQSQNLSSRDPWVDSALIQYLTSGAVDPADSKRVTQRAKSYRMHGGELQRRMGDGRWCTVPPPDTRVALIMSVHCNYGHFGQKRTKAQLLQNWWWAGLEDDVVRVLSTCPYCKQINTVFNAQPHELHSLPIEGMMYRWSCDLAGPLPITTAKNQYAFIAIEHFTKVIVIEALPAKEAQNTSRAFLAHRISSCAGEIWGLRRGSDQGKEWLGRNFTSY
jgi:site-specific DNA-cytosine methylase